MGKKLSNQRIFEVLKRDEVFFNIYLENYFSRLLLSDYKEIKDIFISYNKKNDMDLIELSNKINNPLIGYREKEIDSIIKHISVNKIEKMLELYINNYNTMWNILGVLEKESLLYIHLTRLYPFIDNNQVIIYLILISNLINNNYPPVILRTISPDVINYGDALKFSNILSEKIEEEMLIMIDLYKKHYLFPESVSIDEIIMKKTKY